MDIIAIRDALVAFAKNHNTELYSLSARRSQLLEIGSLAICAEHYRLAGYEVVPSNLQDGFFRVKLGPRGYPWNFSRFECTRGSETIELHANLAVYSDYRKDDRIYVVDVGVCKGDVVPRSTPSTSWHAVENHSLFTFAEAKSVVMYPMLLAQFVGIVSEIAPGFLMGIRPTGFDEAGHFDPALISIGYLRAIAFKIARGYRQRGYLVKIVPDMETKLSLLRNGGHLTSSVLGRENENDPYLPF